MSELRVWFLPDIVGRLHQLKGLSEAKDCQKQRIVNSKHFLVFFLLLPDPVFVMHLWLPGHSDCLQMDCYRYQQ